MADNAVNDVTTLIRQQHDQVRRLLTEVGSGRNVEDNFCELRRLLAVHETAEEEVVYPMLRTTGEEGTRITEARLMEETEGKQILSELEKKEPGSAEFTKLFEKLRTAVTEHASAEESQVLPIIAKLDSSKQQKMAAAFEVAEKTAPTHPHPHAGSSAAANMMAGPALAIMDRVRDAIRGAA